MLSVDSRHGLGSLLWHRRLEKSVSVHRIFINWSHRTYQRHGQGCTNSWYPALHSSTGNGRHASTRPIYWGYQYCKENFTCIWWINTPVIEITLLRACLPVLNNPSDTEVYSDRVCGHVAAKGNWGNSNHVTPHISVVAPCGSWVRHSTKEHVATNLDGGVNSSPSNTEEFGGRIYCTSKLKSIPDHGWVLYQITSRPWTMPLE